MLSKLFLILVYSSFVFGAEPDLKIEASEEKGSEWSIILRSQPYGDVRYDVKVRDIEMIPLGSYKLPLSDYVDSSRNYLAGLNKEVVFDRLVFEKHTEDRYLCIARFKDVSRKTLKGDYFFLVPLDGEANVFPLSPKPRMSSLSPN